MSSCGRLSIGQPGGARQVRIVGRSGFDQAAPRETTEVL
jgi:hypothetical protein